MSFKNVRGESVYNVLTFQRFTGSKSSPRGPNAPPPLPLKETFKGIIIIVIIILLSLLYICTQSG